MSKHARDRRPYVKPVTRLELSESNIKFRWIAIAVLLSIAVVAIGYGFSLALRTEPGWQKITPLSQELNCGSDFLLMYEFDAEDANPTAEYKQLETAYQALTVSGYKLFHAEAEGTDNLYALNRNVNSAVTVAPELYRALEQIVESGSRHVFMAPVLELYAPVFLSATDAEAYLYDPTREPERAALAQEMASFCGNPQMISLELLGDNQASLKVSEEYLSYAREYGIDVFLDFGWMKNAFIADYMADSLTEQGFSKGYLASSDGFTRNLDVRETTYTVNLFHRQGNDIRMPANFVYSGPMSIVSLRDYPMSDQDKWNYYAYQDGSFTSVYLDPADGMCRASIDGVTAYSREIGCAEIALKLAPVFIGSAFDAEALERLAHEGIESVRCSENSIVCTDEATPFVITDEEYRLTVSNVK
jgi:hypothetical protein